MTPERKAEIQSWLLDHERRNVDTEKVRMIRELFYDLDSNICWNQVEVLPAKGTISNLGIEEDVTVAMQLLAIYDCEVASELDPTGPAMLVPSVEKALKLLDEEIETSNRRRSKIQRIRRLYLDECGERNALVTLRGEALKQAKTARDEERAKVVAWLRAGGWCDTSSDESVLPDLANAIERGDHDK